MNFVLRTAHAEQKKRGGHTNPDVRTIIIYEKSQITIHVGLAALAQLFMTIVDRNLITITSHKRTSFGNVNYCNLIELMFTM